VPHTAGAVTARNHQAVDHREPGVTRSRTASWLTSAHDPIGPALAPRRCPPKQEISLRPTPGHDHEVDREERWRPRLPVVARRDAASAPAIAVGPLAVRTTETSRDPTRKVRRRARRGPRSSRKPGSQHLNLSGGSARRPEQVERGEMLDRVLTSRATVSAGAARSWRARSSISSTVAVLSQHCQTSVATGSSTDATIAMDHRFALEHEPRHPIGPARWTFR
jgi:hypothetical protein